jgi:type IV pilus biogenesis protein CpaD/CtpE
MTEITARVQASISSGLFTVTAALMALSHAAIRTNSNASMCPRCHALSATQSGRTWYSFGCGTAASVSARERMQITHFRGTRGDLPRQPKVRG